jgi:single-stranded DNA-binding protein
MNQLNSILIEGNVKEILIKKTYKNGKSLCLFNIETTCIKKTATNNREQVKNNFQISTLYKLAEVCIERLEIGRGVRVVGKLASRQKGVVENIPDVFIEAEHIEFKPVMKLDAEPEEKEKACLTNQI